MNTTEKPTLGELIVLTPITLAGSLIYWPFVVTKLWAWFIAPVFLLDPISIPQSLGLSIFTLMFTPHKIIFMKDTANPKQDLYNRFWYAVLLPSIAWLAGYVVTLFMGAPV